MKEEEISVEQLDAIPEVDSGKGIDLAQFSGLKKKIAKITPMMTKTHYDEEGKYNADVERNVQVLKIETEPVTTIQNKEGKDVVIRASELFNMKRNDKGNWGIPTAEKSKIQQFFKRQKVSKLKDLLGTSVIIKDYEDKTTKKVYLGFVCK